MQKQILLFILATLVSNCYSQVLLTVDWQKVLCTNNVEVYAVCKDNNGDTYTLGSYGGSANCFGDYLSEDTGKYVLIKQDSKGDKIFAKRFGGTDGYLFGDMKMCSNGDMVLGLSFKKDFFLNDSLLTTSKTPCALILRLDPHFNLRWFKILPVNNVTYINKLVMDDHENAYVSIPFADSITIDGNVYFQDNRYGAAIVKFNAEGDVVWSNHIFSNRTLGNKILKIHTSCNSCPSTIFVGGSFGGDSIFINGSFKASSNRKSNGQQFVTILNEYGDILNTKILDKGILSVVDIDFYEGRIFLAGSYNDTITWSGNQVSPVDTSSMYIGEINAKGDLIGFTDLNSRNAYHSHLTSFNISPIYGFVLSGVFDGSFYMQSSSITLPSPYEKGLFIATLDEWLKISGIKYVTGDNLHLSCVSVLNNHISAAVRFTEICNFQNQTSLAPYAAIANFQTTDFNQLTNFHPNPFSTSPSYDSPSVQVYPNPFQESFKLKFDEPIYSTSLRLSNSIGQVCKNLPISKINNLEVIIDAKELSAGMYILQYLTCNNFTGTLKLLKMTN